MASLDKAIKGLGKEISKEQKDKLIANAKSYSFIGEFKVTKDSKGNKIIKISGSALSGSNVYSAWDPINKKIVTGSVYGPNTHWKNYVKVFQELSSQRKFSYELNYLQTIELLETIGIKL